MHYLLIYDVVPDFVERRAEFRDQHLGLAWAASDQALRQASTDTNMIVVDGIAP